MMSSNMPLDFLPGVHSSHSRSNSVSSSSTHSSNSRPQSSQGGLSRMQAGMAPSAEDLYRATYHLGHHNNGLQNDHVRLSRHLLLYICFTKQFTIDLQYLSQSPPNHNITNPALKNHLRPSHIRARAAASPYPRDTDSVHSSSSEADDMAMYLGNPAPDYQNMFGGGTMAPNQEAMHAAGAFGRMTLNNDHALEKLAANVRAATTTSASDRAKQIFVQAWCVTCFSYCGIKLMLSPICLGSPPITPHIPTVMCLARGSTSPIVVSVTNTGSHTLIPPHWARPSDCASPLSRPGAWVLEEIANITVSFQHLFFHHVLCRS